LSSLFEQFSNGVNAFGLFTIAPKKVNGKYAFSDNTTFNIGRIRLTLSIPTDFRLYGSAKLANDPSATKAYPTTVDDSDRIDFTMGGRLAYVNALGLLQLEQRYQSFPVPQTAHSDLTFPDGVIRDDTDEANNQAVRKLNDLGRLDRTSMLVSNKIALTYSPGTMLQNLNNIGGPGGEFPLRCCVKFVHYDFESRPQKLTIGGI
jgi:hypothetical protein